MWTAELHSSENEADRFLDHPNTDQQVVIQPAQLVVSRSSSAPDLAARKTRSAGAHWIISSMLSNIRLKIAIVGTGISGLVRSLASEPAP